MKKTLTDRFVKSIRPAPRGKRVAYWDTVVRGFGVVATDKVTDKAKAADKRRAANLTYVVQHRWPRPDGSAGPSSRRAIGDARAISLEAARAKARRLLDVAVTEGVDPKLKEKQEQAAKAAAARAEAALKENTFEKVAVAWFRHIADQRKAAEVERDVRRAFLQRWADRPVTDITRADIERVVASVRDTPAQARNLLGYIKRMMEWASRQARFGMADSPAEKLKAQDFVGKKKRGDRVLTDNELRLLWRAVGRLRTQRLRDEDDELSNWFLGDYPFGPLFRLLILTGQRKSEVADARWREFDLPKRLWTIPAERMKSGAAHVVPLTDEMVTIIDSLPRPTSKKRDHDHLFSTMGGEKPVNSFGKVKARIDRRMLSAMRALARAGGADTDDVELPGWTIHDIRRTMRTNLSALPIPDRVAEAMIAHAAPELHRVYDLHKYVEEKRRGFELWSAHLRGILQRPDPDSNVVTLQRRG